MSASFAASSLYGGVILNNGLPDGLSGNEMTQWLEAEDFRLPLDFTLTDIRFWDAELTSDYLGSIYWAIYSDNSEPATLLFSGTVVPIRTPDPTASCCSDNGFIFTGFRNDFSVGSISLTGNTTYWIALHNGPPGTTPASNFYWASTGTNGTSTGLDNFIPFADNIWAPNYVEHAFELFGTTSGVPEPGGFALIGLGMMGIGAIGRRLIHALRNRKP